MVPTHRLLCDEFVEGFFLTVPGPTLEFILRKLIELKENGLPMITGRGRKTEEEHETWELEAQVMTESETKIRFNGGFIQLHIMATPTTNPRSWIS